MADETGGAFFENSNDLVPGVQRLQADLGHYYLIGFESTRPPDDKYRELRVRVKRDGVTVLARRGYLAARRAETDRVRAHDVALLLALQQEKVPNQFPFTARTFAVPSPDGPDLLLIVATVPRESITQSLAANAPAALSLLARVKDAKGTPIRYASERFTFDSAADLAGPLIFWKTAALPAGLYTVEVAAYHEGLEQASVRLLTAGMPPGRKTQLGDVMRTRAVVPAAAPRPVAMSVPLGGWWVQPSLNETVRAGDEVPFLFCAVAPASALVDVTIMKDGKALATTRVSLPAAGPDGRSVYAGRVPTLGYAAGTYQLKVALELAELRESRAMSFRIESQSEEPVP